MDFTPNLGDPRGGVVITGGASGIGLATAEALAAVGRSVVLWDIQQQAAEQAAADLAERYGVKAAGLHVDLRDAAAISAAAEQSRAAIGAINGVVHSAGTAEVTMLDGVTPNNFGAGMNLHVRPIILLSQAFHGDMKAVGGGSIVALASINATLGSAMIPIYTAAKGAVQSLVRSLADSLAEDGIRVNSVSPGQIDTPIMAAAKANAPGYFERRIMLGRYGEAAEVARVIRFLLSPEASYITAADILVDGGNIHSSRM
jgi:NAD(P)-dependent dehydrogenase (short-subunit alcohol dehydrogenase family)